MKVITLLLILIILTASPIYAQEILECTDNKIDVHYFYSTGCSHCANVRPLIDKIKEDKNTYPDIEIYIHETHDEDDHNLFNTACSIFNIQSKGVPLVIIGDTYYQGDKEILENLKKRITVDKNFNDYTCQLLCHGIQNVTIEENPDTQITWPLVITSGLIDGINPCAFAVLIFLTATLIAIGNKRKMIITGTVYIIAVYMTYFVAGIGLLSVIQYAGITKSIYTLAASIAIIFGLINIKDFFWHGKGISLKIPQSKKATISRYAKRATIPSAIVLGFLVSMFELPCTGGIYFAIIGLLSSKMTQAAAIPYLLVYNFFFILPLIIILIAVYKGTDPKTLEKLRLSERKWMKLALGTLMILLGIAMLGGYI